MFLSEGSGSEAVSTVTLASLSPISTKDFILCVCIVHLLIFKRFFIKTIANLQYYICFRGTL